MYLFYKKSFYKKLDRSQNLRNFLYKKKTLLFELNAKFAKKSKTKKIIRNCTANPKS